MWNVNESMLVVETFEGRIFSLNTKHWTLSELHCDTEKMGILIDWISSSPVSEVHIQLYEPREVKWITINFEKESCEFYKENIF